MQLPSQTVDYKDLKGRVVIVTGAGQGIGRFYCDYIAAQGAIPVIAEITDKGADVAKEIRAAGADALYVQTDVGDEASTKACAEAVLKKFGRIDGLVNNAAMFRNLSHAPFWELDLAEWNRTLQVNVTGSFLMARAVAPAMKERKWGRIINVSSGVQSIGYPNFMHYVTSKSAVVGMTRSMARELGSWNITVNTFWPARTRTEINTADLSPERFKAQIDLQCLKRETTPDDHSRVILFLLSDQSEWVNGHNIAADGGYKFL